MNKRKGLSKKTRFEVFKRDSFTCQYCGKSAPDVILVVDHLHPVSKGGSNDLLNLVTSCEGCNSGKSDRTLDDATVVQKQRAELEKLSERRNQLKLMVQWKESLNNIVEEEIALIQSELGKFSAYKANENGIIHIRKWLKKHTLQEILIALNTSFEQYLKIDQDGKAIAETWEKAFDYIPRIAQFTKKNAGNPHALRCQYIRAILTNRFDIYGYIALKHLNDAITSGATIESLERFAKNVDTWGQFEKGIEDFIAKQGVAHGEST